MNQPDVNPILNLKISCFVKEEKCIYIYIYICHAIQFFCELTLNTILLGKNIVIPSHCVFQGLI